MSLITNEEREPILAPALCMGVLDDLYIWFEESTHLTSRTLWVIEESIE